MSRLALVAPILLWLVCAPAPASAQDAVGESPAHISVVDGAALLERDGRSESAPASMPLLAGDRVRTQSGRVEILFNDGSTLHLDSNTTVDFQSDEVIRLLDGRVRLNIVAPAARIAAWPTASMRRRRGCRSRARANTGSRWSAATARRSRARGAARRRRPGQRRWPHDARRRRAGVRPRRRGPVAVVRLQFGVVGHLRSLVGSPARFAPGRVG